MGKLLTSALYGLLPAILLSGCTAFRAGGEVQKGRFELMYGDPNAALTHFQRAADLNPNYVFTYSPFRPSVWTYVGRAHYQARKLSEASSALEQALARNRGDALARFYLGLALSRSGARERGVKELESGLAGVRSDLDYLQRYTIDGHYWDPGDSIRKEIEASLAMIQGRDISWERLIANGEKIGHELEREIDEARREARRERHADSDNDKP